jgi:hypothetical protein
VRERVGVRAVDSGIKSADENDLRASINVI